MLKLQREHLIEKLLFGSDYPLRVFPRAQKAPDMSRYITHIGQESGLSEAELRLLLGGNFAELIQSSRVL